MPLPDDDRPHPLIGPGVLVENFSKRSEASNRKYRAFYKNTMPTNFSQAQNKNLKMTENYLKTTQASGLPVIPEEADTGI